MPETWNVYLETSTNICTVQRPEERPLFGVRHLGPFSSKTAATKAMCDDIDPTMTNQTQCWSTRDPNACSGTKAQKTKQKTKK